MAEAMLGRACSHSEAMGFTASVLELGLRYRSATKGDLHGNVRTAVSDDIRARDTAREDQE